MIGNLISKILLLLQNNIKMLVNKAIFLVTNNIKAQMFTLYYKWILVAPSIIILIKLHTNNYRTQDRNLNYPHPFESISYSPNNLGHCNKKNSRADHSFVQNNQSPHSHGSNHDNEDVLSFISSNATTKVY